ncbi:MAG: serine/threonine-protein kinase, partial [Cyanobacteria bacterium J06598_3]
MSTFPANGLLNHRYRLIKSLAEGGFGKTFLAEDTQMPSRRQCVIKQLKPVSARPEVMQLVQQRFAREAAVLESVGKGHSQIPDLYAYFEENGQFYLVQEWVEGAPLIARASEAWPEARVVALLRSALDALGHVHKQGIIHRDIKPDNIILRQSDQLPCLIDFGAVKELMSTVVGLSGS